jgi:hypothetical protein
LVGDKKRLGEYLYFFIQISGFQVEMVTNEIGNFAKKHEDRLLHHINVEAIQLLGNSELVRRPQNKKASSIYDSTYA